MTVQNSGLGSQRAARLWFLLRPLRDLTGWSYFIDKLVHVVVPIMAVAGWLIFGPRPRIRWVEVGRSFIWPLLWLVYTMIIGATTTWYPYLFLDAGHSGYGSVAIAAVSITAIFAILAGLFKLGDARLPNGRFPSTAQASARTRTPELS